MAAIIAVAVLVIGGAELLLRLFEVPQYILPTPSAIASVFFSHEIPTILEHYSYTLVELLAGYAIGASIGLVLAAVITQFPFVEKVITPYILLLVTTPMLALVPLLILNFSFGFTPRVIAVALASGPMVMINAATGFRRVDAMKIALVRSCGASTLQIFSKIRIPMAMPMVIVGLMIGAIFGMITAVGADRHVGRWIRPWQPPDNLFLNASDAGVLRLRPDPRHYRDHDLRVLFLARQEACRLGKLTKTGETQHSTRAMQYRGPTNMGGNLMAHQMMTRRRLLQISAGGLVTTTVLGGGVLMPGTAEAKPYMCCPRTSRRSI